MTGLRTGLWLLVSVGVHLLALLVFHSHTKPPSPSIALNQDAYSMTASIYRPPPPAIPEVTAPPPPEPPAEKVLSSKEDARRVEVPEPPLEPPPAPPEPPKPEPLPPDPPEAAVPEKPVEPPPELPPEPEAQPEQPVTQAPADEPSATTPDTQGAQEVMEPSAIISPPPAYPFRGRRAGYEGTVLLTVEVGADGSVLAVSLKESSGYGILDQAAIETVEKKWRFEPYPDSGKLTTTTQVKINFTLAQQ